MSDDAVAPVIAVMLLLAAVATLFVIFNGAYIPSLKEASEIEHLHAVESSFQLFSSDIERAVADARAGMTLSEPVQMGGGDVFLNPLRSGGSLAVTNESEPVYYLVLINDQGPVFFNSTIANISYTPVDNFWQDQGYRWQYGYLNVTKYGTKQTPLSYSNMTEVNNAFSTSGSLTGFAGSFARIEYSKNLSTLFPVYDENGNITAYGPRQGNCSGMVLWAVNISASKDHPFTSSNGFGRLELKSRITPVELYNVSYIGLVSGGTPFGNATARSWNESFSAVAAACNSNIPPGEVTAGDGFSMYSIRQEISPVNVTLNILSIEIGAY